MTSPPSWWIRRSKDSPNSTSPPARRVCGTDVLDDVRRFYRDATPTPLHRLPARASALGLGELLIKDESRRFSMPAFKIAGVRYAAARLLEGRDASRDTTLVAASTGNHGRAVARVAAERGHRARIYLPAGAQPWRAEAIRSEGADVIVTDRTYDDTVRLMAAEASAHGWTVISDAAWDGYEDVPRWIMAGYSILMEEAARDWGASPPDVIVVQAGVGSLGGGVAGWLAARFGEHDRPRLVIAEPAGSACVQASLHAGRRVALTSCEPTAMAGLQCAEVSPLGWLPIHAVADAAVSVTESQNDAAMQQFAAGLGDDITIAAGPSGACGLAAITRMMTEPELAPVRDELSMGPGTRAMAFVTEGQ